MKLTWPESECLHIPQRGSTVAPFTVSKHGGMNMKMTWKPADPNTHLGMTNAITLGCSPDLWDAYVKGANWRWLSPATVAVGGTQKRELTADWWGTVNGSLLCIRKGYRFDGASIPRAFWFVVGQPFDPRHEAAALVHDMLYGTGMLPREQADWVLREMIEKSKGKLQHVHGGIFWMAVRGFGWSCGFGKSKKDAKFLDVWAPYGTLMEA